jgi:hypothetical protein
MPTQGSWAADNGNRSSFRHDECWVCEWCSMLLRREVSILGVDPEYGDMFLRNLAAHVQDYTDHNPEIYNIKITFRSRHYTAQVTCSVRRKTLDQKCQYEWRLKWISSNVWAFLLRALKKHIDLATTVYKWKWILMLGAACSSSYRTVVHSTNKHCKNTETRGL